MYTEHGKGIYPANSFGESFTANYFAVLLLRFHSYFLLEFFYKLNRISPIKLHHAFDHKAGDFMSGFYLSHFAGSFVALRLCIDAPLCKSASRTNVDRRCYFALKLYPFHLYFRIRYRYCRKQCLRIWMAGVMEQLIR